jgi:hypothetical protein
MDRYSIALDIEQRLFTGMTLNSNAFLMRCIEMNKVLVYYFIGVRAEARRPFME